MAFLQTFFNAQSGTANATSSVITLSDNLSIENAGLQITATGFNTADATVKLLQSADGVNYAYTKDTDGSDWTLTITSNTTFQQIFSNIAFKFYKLEFNKGTNSAGTFSSHINFN